MIAHVAKRIGLIMIGYLAAMVMIAILVWGSDWLVGPDAGTSFYLPEGPPSFLPPEFAKLVLTLALLLVLPLLPALVLILASESFRWRRLWVYLIGWVLVFAVVAFSISLPFSTSGTTVANISALLGGFVYWAIAGRQAGGPKDFTP